VIKDFIKYVLFPGMIMAVLFFLFFYHKQKWFLPELETKTIFPPIENFNRKGSSRIYDL
jgi:hypothetical protein